MANCWLVRDVMADMLVVKNQSISLLWELNSIFIQMFWEKFYFIDHQHGRLVTWLQTKTAERLKIVSSKPAIKLERIRICLLKIMKQFTKSDWEVFAGCKSFIVAIFVFYQLLKQDIEHRCQDTEKTMTAKRTQLLGRCDFEACAPMEGNYTF